MEVLLLVSRIDVDRGDDMILERKQLFYLPCPVSGVLAVCPNEFLRGKTLVGVVPVDDGAGAKNFCIASAS